MINGSLVVDAVVHPYNLAPDNQNPEATAQLESVYSAHVLATGEDHEEHILKREEFFSDFPFEAIARSLFVESPIDFAVIHALPNLGFAREHVTDPMRAGAYRDKHPERFRLYATVDTPVVADAIKQLERQVRDLEVVGLKLYPAFFYDNVGEGWRMDGDDFATPVIEAARDLGIKHVAVHKALWLRPAPRSAFDIDDMAGALERFPDLTFQMVHAGSAFVDQTVELLKSFQNMYATLESTFAYAVVRPEVFSAILGKLLRECGADQLLFASGSNLSHPAPLLEAFSRFQFSDQDQNEHGFPPLSEEDRAKILGGNLIRQLGLDEQEIRSGIAQDEFTRARAESPVRPWSAIRDGAFA
jgi:predicted TIM-barrel fold metal-dependent hydrolase